MLYDNVLRFDIIFGGIWLQSDLDGVSIDTYSMLKLVILQYRKAFYFEYDEVSQL
jgi:hypothetical protein